MDKPEETGTADELANMIDSFDKLETPPEVTGLYPNDEDKQKAANHAFAETKRKAKELIEKQNARIKELEEKGATPPVPPAPPVVTGDDTSTPFVTALTQQAMLNVGLAGKTQLTLGQQHMVQMEMNRLYSDMRSAQTRELELRNSAPRIIAEKLASFERLNDEDRTEIIKRLSKKSLTEQVNDETI
jgi:hypothetical protein